MKNNKENRNKIPPLPRVVLVVLTNKPKSYNHLTVYHVFTLATDSKAALFHIEASSLFLVWSFSKKISLN